MVHKGNCSCSDSYTGENMRNEQIQIDEHSNTCNDFKPARQRARTLCVLLAGAYSARPISQAKNPRRPNFPVIERLSMTFTANGKNETFAVSLQLSVQ